MKIKVTVQIENQLTQDRYPFEEVYCQVIDLDLKEDAAMLVTQVANKVNEAAIREFG